MLMLVLLMGLFIPHLNLINARKGRLIASVLAVIGLAVILGSIMTADFDSRRPQTNNLFYGLDTDTGKATWGSTDEKPDAWTSQFFSTETTKGTLNEFFPLSTRKFLLAQAPAAQLAAPDIRLLEETEINGARRLRLHISSPRQAPVINLYLDPDSQVEAAQINGKAVNLNSSRSRGQEGRQWSLRYYALPSEGFDLTLDVKPSKPLKLRLVDQSYGLPELPGAARARPDNIIPAPLAFSDATLVSKSFTL